MTFWRKGKKNGASLQKAEEKEEKIIDLINQYRFFERTIEVATEEIEAKARDFACRRKPEPDIYEYEVGNLLIEAKEETNPLLPECRGSKNQGVSIRKYNVDLSTARRRAELARRFRLPLNVFSRPLHAARTAPTVDPEVEELEDLDAKLSLWRYHLRSLEHQILELAPADIDSAMQKMKFVTELIIKGDELDVDYFAYLIQECVDVCDENLAEILKNYRKHMPSLFVESM
ncbi:hypothetical protein [Rhodosalinus sp. 5P4]|uniref:hypothetical protein n=1 Tax=Rhodosalinus sp. 5P4 TaxID=3239196 RepID=UPI003524864C